MTKVDEIMELATILGYSRYLAGAGKSSREDVQDNYCNLRTAIESLAKDAKQWQAYKARKDAVIAAGMGRNALRKEQMRREQGEAS